MKERIYWRKEATQHIKSLIMRAEYEYKEMGRPWIVTFDKDKWRVTVLYDENLSKEEVDEIEISVNHFLRLKDIPYYMTILYGTLKKIVKIPDPSKDTFR